MALCKQYTSRARGSERWVVCGNDRNDGNRPPGSCTPSMHIYIRNNISYLENR